ncbi:hypothetical protein [Deinococcus pimensis]|uniref:hypothetical protein n=1 Tax=Deinococcus pimensis TaxID=309888 RepID=UPI0004B58CFA|nr:hypothetical protein [Deinococcus pimensis]
MTRSSLGRPLDPSVPSNRFAALGFALTFVAARVAGRTWLQSAQAGLGAFLAWSAGRELHPDDPNAANVALLIEAPLAILAPPSVPAAFGHTSALRVVAGTVGEKVTPVDEAALATLGGVSAAGDAIVTAFMMPAASMLTVGVGDRLSPPPPFSAITALGFAGALRARVVPPTGVWRWVVLGTLVGTLGLLSVPTVRVREDHSDEPVSTERVRRARLLGLAALGATAIFEGDAGLRRSSPLLSAWLGTALTSLVSALRKR